MANGEKLVPFTIVGERYDNSMAEELFPDEQLIDSFRILSPDYMVTLQDLSRLRAIKEALPYREGDFKIVEVLPYRDYDVDYTKVVFDLAWAFTDESMRSSDGESILMKMWDARAIAETGVLFGVIPQVIQRIPGLSQTEEDQEVNFEDDIPINYSFGPLGPIAHEPDIPVSSGNVGPNSQFTQNGRAHTKPPVQRARRDPRQNRHSIPTTTTSLS